MDKKIYLKPKIEVLDVYIEEGIAVASIQTGDSQQSTPEIEDWVDESRTESYFFD